MNLLGGILGGKISITMLMSIRDTLHHTNSYSTRSYPRSFGILKKEILRFFLHTFDNER